MPRPACAHSLGRLKKLRRTATLAGRAAARMLVSGKLASVLMLDSTLGGGAAALSDSGDFHDFYYLRT